MPPDIDEQAALSAIGTAGYTKLCSAFDDYVHDTYRSQLLVKAACTAHAVETTADAVACSAALDDCLGTLPPAVDAQLDRILDQASCTALLIEPSACDSRVTALKQCLDALGSLVDQVELGATCAAAGSPVPDSWWRIAKPAACQALESGC